MPDFSFRPAVRREFPLRVLVFGLSGSGKTYSGLAIGVHLCEELGLDPAQAIGVIDSEIVDVDENGDGDTMGSAEKYVGEPCRCSRCLGLGLHFAFQRLHLPPGHQTPEDYCRALRAARQAGVQVLLIDGITHEWKALLQLVDDIRQQKGKRHDPWQDATPRHDAFMAEMLNFPGHVIATCRAKEKSERVQGDSGKTEYVDRGLQPIFREGVDGSVIFEFDASVLMDQGHRGHLVKARGVRLEGQAYPKPGADLARDLLLWCRRGNEAPSGEEAERIRRWKERRAEEERAKVENLRAWAEASEPHHPGPDPTLAGRETSSMTTRSDSERTATTESQDRPQPDAQPPAEEFNPEPPAEAEEPSDVLRLVEQGISILGGGETELGRQATVYLNKIMDARWPNADARNAKLHGLHQWISKQVDAMDAQEGQRTEAKPRDASQQGRRRSKVRIPGR